MSVTPAFLNHLRSLYPFPSALRCDNAALRNPWYIAASVAFSASNHPEFVPVVFQHVLREMKHVNRPGGEQKLLVGKMREALLKSGLLCGLPKTINALMALHEVVPEHLRDTQITRNTRMTLEELESKGNELFRMMYGTTTHYMDQLLYDIYPDLNWYAKTIGYGMIYAHTPVLTQSETSCAVVATLIANNTPRQINWHMAAARRTGASMEELRAIRQIAIEVGKYVGMEWTDGVPEVVYMLESENKVQARL